MNEEQMKHIANLISQDIEKDKEIDRLKTEKDSLDDCNRSLYNENKRLNNIIYLIKNSIDITIQIIKEQPTRNDEWILERLNGIKNIGEKLGGNDNE